MSAALGTTIVNENDVAVWRPAAATPVRPTR
jgi:hypothetical protein